MGLHALHQSGRHAVTFIEPTPNIQHPARRGTHFRQQLLQNMTWYLQALEEGVESIQSDGIKALGGCEDKDESLVRSEQNTSELQSPGVISYAVY